MKEVMLRGKAVRLVTQLYGGGCKFAFGRTDSLFLCAALRTSSSTMYKGHQQHFQRAHGNIGHCVVFTLWPTIMPNF